MEYRPCSTVPSFREQHHRSRDSLRIFTSFLRPRWGVPLPKQASAVSDVSVGRRCRSYSALCSPFRGTSNENVTCSGHQKCVSVLVQPENKCLPCTCACAATQVLTVSDVRLKLSEIKEDPSPAYTSAAGGSLSTRLQATEGG